MQPPRGTAGLFVAGHPDLSHCLLWPTRVASVVTAPDCAPTPLSAWAAALRTHVREKEGAAGDGEARVPGAACLWPGEGQQVILVWSQATQVAEGKLQGCKCGGWESQARRPGCCGQWEDPVCRSFCSCTKGTPMAPAIPPGVSAASTESRPTFTSHHLGFVAALHGSAMTPEGPRAGLSAAH